MKVEIKYKGHSVSCYGKMHPEQNVNIVCENEFYDQIYPNGFENWTECVHFIIDKLPKTFPNPVQMEAV